MSNERFLTTAEVAGVLGVTVRQVSRLVPHVLEPVAKGPGARGAYLFDRGAVMRERQRRVDAALLAVASLDADEPRSRVETVSVDGSQVEEASHSVSPAILGVAEHPSVADHGAP